MPRRLIPAILLVAYSAFVVRLLVFKIQMLQLGHLRFRFAPETGDPNFLPFRSILRYLGGDPNWLIATLNLAGNIAILVPVGFLAAWVFRSMTWLTAIIAAAAVGLAIEGTQAILAIGIFDIDDVILNALGVVIGYGAFTMLAKRARSDSKPQ